MIASFQISSLLSGNARWFILAGMSYILLAIIGLQHYLEWSSANFLLGIPTLALLINHNNKPASPGFVLMALAFTVLAILVPLQTFLYFGIAAALLFLLGNAYGRQGILPLMVIVLMSPVFKYFVSVFSFPIRLQLTALAGKILTVSGSETSVQGNMLNWNGNEFSVDPGCMGLNMMTTSLLLGIMLLAFYQRTYQKRLHWSKIGVLLMIIAALNIVCNLFRILCLVRFTILPGTFVHDAIGIICLLIYVIVPAIFITRYVVSRSVMQIKSAAENDLPAISSKQAVVHLFLALGICVGTYKVIMHKEQLSNPVQTTVHIKGYKTSAVFADILKLENEHSLVYIKPIPGFYNTDHNPMICWQGSGYTLEQVKEWSINNSVVYTALLKNKQEQLHTAWWYDNGTSRTINQLSWRWDALRGARDYSLVNVTAASRQQLAAAVSSIQNDSEFKGLLIK